jgi:thymidine kinase
MLAKQVLTDNEIDELLDIDTNSTYDPKDAFLDTINPYKYIELDSNALAFDRVHRALNRNLKMTLIYGSPGTGKSMFLSRLHSELLSQRKHSLLVSTPILDDNQLFQTIAFELFRESQINTIPRGFDELIDAISIESAYVDRVRPILLFDEAQLYLSSTLEKIRLLADTGSIRVIFAVHKLKEEDIFTKEHFKSRIWEKIELTNATPNELRVYIQKKLMNFSMLSLANQFSRRVVRHIYHITEGNYRVTNNLLYAYFQNYPQLWRPQFQNKKLKIRPKEIEITAIQIGFIKSKSSNYVDLRHLPTAEAVWLKWRNRRFMKYSFLFLTPPLLYLLYKTYLPEFNFTNQITSIEQNTTKEIKEIVKTQEPEQKIESPKDVIDNSRFENSNFDESGVEKRIEKQFNDDYNETSENKYIEEPETADIVEVEKEQEIDEKNISISKLFEKVEDNFQKELKLEEESLEAISSSFNDEVVENIPLEELKFNRAIFNNPLKLIPSITITDYTSPNIVDIDNGYITSMKTRFQEHKTIDIAIKILQYYKLKRSYPEIYRYSVELNRLDSSLKEPYLNIERILRDEREFESAEMVKEGCKTCN